MSSACNNIKIDSQEVISNVACAMCSKCLISVNHDKCLCKYVNDKKSCGKNQKAKDSVKEIQKKYQPKIAKPKKVGTSESLATPKPRKPRFILRWSPTGNLKLLINFVWKFMGTVRFRNDHVAAILGFGDLQWGNILITRVYFVEGLGHNLFSVGQFCDSDLEVEGVDLLKRDRSINLYTINLHEMASASPICLMARASSTKPRLWHQRLSHLNFDTINDLARNDLVAGLPKFKYHKEHLCPSCESKDEAPEVIIKFLKRITVLLQSHVIIIRTNNGTKFKNQMLKEYIDTVGISHQMSSVRTPQQNGAVERRNRTLVEAARTMLISSRAPLFLWAEAIATACFTQNRSIIQRRFNKTPYELINGRKSDISFLHVFRALCYPKNDREDIGKLGAKGDIGFFIGYSADSCTYRVFNRRSKKIMETMNVSFDELSAMAFEQRSSKPGLNSMTSGHISLGLHLTYAPATITTQQPSEGELDLLFEAMYDDYIGGQPSATARTAIATACFTQNRSITHRRFNKTPYELINDRKPDISFLHVFGALCYPKNDREDIGKLGAKGDIGFFIGYSADSCAYRVYNRRTKKIMETMNVSFDELSVMAFDQSSSKPRLQSMTSGQISSGLDLKYAPSTITTQQPSEGELDLLFEAMYDDYIGGQPSATGRNVPPAPEPQVCQTSMASTTIADTAPIPTNLSSHATNVHITSQDVDELNPNAMVDGNTFVNPFANPSTSAATASSSQQNVDPSNMHTFYQPYPHEFQSTKDHPLEQVIGEPSRLVLTRNQLRSDGDMCMYALSVSTMEPNNVKEAMTDPAWIASMQEELLQFKRLDLFFELMKSRFEMSMMGEMTFFLGLEVNQSSCGIFINQSKYVLENLNKYRMESCDPVGTLMEIKDKLDLDQNGTPVDDFDFELTEFSDADYVGCKDTFKSTSGGAQFLGEKLVSWSSKKQDYTALSTAEAKYVSLSACCT
nr:integrase, catalytic region, zinc finger, CCHC-type, peptidase aspartic, catalytic [Tanacetum cinerariifolium]